MKAYEWIDRLKVKKCLPSDYAAAKLLGMTTAAITQLRSRGSTLSEDISLKLAHELELNPVLVLTDQATERAKSESVQREWNSILRELMSKEKTPHMAGLVLGGNGGIRTLDEALHPILP